MPGKYLATVILAIATVTGPAAASAKAGHEEHPPYGADAPRADSCDRPHVGCAVVGTPTVDESGRLWLVHAQGEHVYVSHSDDGGNTFSPAVAANKAPETLYADGENRPKIAVDGKRVYVSWVQRTGGRYTGDIRFGYSVDGGRTFTQPRTINDDDLLTSHRFDSLHVAENGDIYLFWLDKRDKMRAKDGDYVGAAVYYSVSSDGGATFTLNRKLADHACECCRLATAKGLGEGGGAVVFWRHVFENSERDHALMQVTPDGVSAFQRVTRDQWRINACPHHGPAISAGSQAYHAVWFTHGDKHKGLFYGRLSPTGEALGYRHQLDASPGASHPQVAARADTVVALWKRFDGEKTQLLFKVSRDGGQTWLPERLAAATTGESDHPQVFVAGDRFYASWVTDEGFSIWPLSETASGEKP